jgi:hypothetical protein
MTAHLLPSRRLLAGGLAVAAGSATIVAPVVAPPLGADPLDGSADASPSAAGDAGTYESCTAMFGLTDKDNANYVTFSVDGTADPLPAIGDGLTPVLTVVADGETTECTPEVGFDDVASWQTYLAYPPSEAGEEALLQAAVPAPTSPGYLVPGGLQIVGLRSVGPAALDITSVSLRLEGVPSGVSVSVDPTELAYADFDGDAFLEGVLTRLGGPGTLAGGRFVSLLEGNNTCDVPPSAADEALATGLIDLVGLPDDLRALLEEELVATGSPCDGAFQSGLFLLALQAAVPVLGLDVAVTATADPPGPAPEPTPEPVTPSFTG